MRVAFYQSCPIYGDVDYNLFTALGALGSTKSDLYVLPELFSTGYLFGSRKELSDLAEPVPSGPTTRGLIQFCRSERCAIVAGVAEKEGKKFYNSAILVGPRGLIGKYRKTHLFNQEKLWFHPGNTGFQVWRYKNARIGLMICFDWIYPEAARALALKGADIICHPSNLVLPYCQAAMKTRSIENRVFTITANRVGKEIRGKVELTFSGMSQITDPLGGVLARAPEATERIVAVKIRPEQARNKKATPGNQIFRDRRPVYYKDLTKRV
jgi:predicted amidohydrolase